MVKKVLLILCLFLFVSPVALAFRSALIAPGFVSGDTQNISVFWEASGTSIYYNGGNVGIGTSSPSTSLQVMGVISATGGNSTIWNEAYSWGDHALVGYLTTELDPTVPSYVKNITLTDISNWDEAYSWGDHADAGYVDTESDPTVPSYVKQITLNNISNWSTAYSWGDHALAGYYPYTNPYNFINTSDFYNLSEGVWVRITGDNMTGNLDMGDNNITGVDTLFVHNITGRSPIYMSSPVIASTTITAETFYGNIQGNNGTIYGVTITNGTIENLMVGSSAYFNTDALPFLNNTFTLGSPDLMWKTLYTDSIVVNNLSSPELDELYNLIDAVNQSIKQPSGPYLAYDNTSFWVDETALNFTINEISKVRKITYNLTCTTSGGACSVISPINITHLITEIVVTPTSPLTNYRFLLTEYPSLKVIDQDRKVHVGVWDIEKNYGLDSPVQANISSSSSDELFTITIVYLTNGVQS